MASGEYAILNFEPTGSSATQEKTVRGTKRRLAAAAMSLIVPGLGQWFLGAHRRAIAFSCSFAAVILCHWPLRLPKFIFAWWALVLALLVLCAWAACDALRVQEGRAQKVLQGSRWWALLLVPTALLTASWDANRLLHFSGFGVYSIPSESMEDTIDRGDRILVDLRAYEHSHPAVGDIIVFRKGNQQIVKRVVATGGDTIFGIGGKLVRNGAVLNEPYVRHVGPTQPQLDNFGLVRIPANMLFVAGDSRNVSFDSRTPDFGLVDESALVGKPLYIYRSDRDRSGKAIH